MLSLSLQAFQTGMNLLAMNYNRQLPEPILLIWRDYLERELTDEEFIEAVKHTILHSRFMPTAGELVEFVKSGKEARAIQEWQIILQASRRNDSDSLSELSDRGRVALAAVGGVYQLGMAEDSFVRQRMEKNFITVYCQVSDKDCRNAPTVSPVAPSSPSEEPQGSVPMPEEVRRQMEALKAKLAMSRKK